VRFDVQPATAMCDARLVKVALENLLGNAWKFTGRRPQATIEFGCREEQGEVIYHVRDNGAGFEMAYAGRLFRPFQRLHHEGEFPGTGIGLATVQRVIELHGGRIWAEAELDKGAAFFFTLASAAGH
jgi:signal transduction histidine kinase